MSETNDLRSSSDPTARPPGDPTNPRRAGGRGGRGRSARLAAAIATLALGAGAAVGLAACGEDREGSVENIGGETTGTGATVPTGATTAPTTETGATTGTTTGPE